MELLSRCDARLMVRREVERGGLMGVLPVAENLSAGPCLGCPARKLLRIGLTGHPPPHGDVVTGRVRECLSSKVLTLLEIEAARAHGLENVPVPSRCNHHGHVRVVLRRRADHRRAADVDLLDTLVDGSP